MMRNARAWLASGVFAAGISLAAQPANDAFARRQELAGTHFEWLAAGQGATLEAGEPNHAGSLGPARGSVWAVWQPPADGFLLLNLLENMSVPPVVAVYTGEELASLILVRRITDWNQPPAYFPVRGGVPCQVAAAVVASQGYVKARIGFSFVPRPPNDDFAQRTLVAGAEAQFSGWTVGAGLEAGEPAPPDAAGSTWWSWTAPADGVANLSVVGRPASLAVRVYQGASLAALRPVANPELFETKAGETFEIQAAGPSLPYGLEFTVNLVLSRMRIVFPPAHALYSTPANILVQVANPPENLALRWFRLLDGYTWLVDPLTNASQILVSNLVAGDHELWLEACDSQYRTWRSPRVPITIRPWPNTYFTNRTDLAGADFELAVDLRGAVSKAGEPDQRASLWWAWTPGQSGWVDLVFDRRYDLGFQLYTGQALNALTEINWVAQAEDRLEFPVQAGVEYQLRAATASVYGFGPLPVRVALRPPPPNDAFDHPRPLSPNGAGELIPLGKATSDPSDPALLAAGGLKTVWFAWTAPRNGWLRLSATSYENYVPFVGVYLGNSPATLTPLAAPVAGPVPVLAGQVCQIVLAGRGGLLDETWFEAGFLPRPDNDTLEQAAELPGSTGTNLVVLTGATNQAVWYAWTAPEDGLLEFGLNFPGHPAPAAGILAFLAASQGSLAQVWPGEDQQNPLYRARQFDVAQGARYYFKVYAPGNDPNPPEGELWHRLNRRPGNDAFTNRLVLQAGTTAWKAGNLAATSELGELEAIGHEGRSVWWEWTAPQDGWVAFTGRAPNAMPYVDVFQGETLASLRRIAELQVFPERNQCAAWFTAKAGGKYVLLLDSPGQLVLRQLPFDQGWRSLLFPAGETSLALTWSAFRISLPTNGAQFTLPALPRIEIATPDPALDGVLTNVTLLARRLRDAAGWPSAGDAYETLWRKDGLTLPISLQPEALPPGICEILALGTNTAGEMRATLPVQITLRPANDDPAHALVQAGRYTEVSGSTRAATAEPGETGLASDSPGVWYRWTAPADGQVELTATSPCAVFTGQPPGDWKRLGDTNIPPVEWVNFDAVAGATYQIAVLTPAGNPDGADFSLRLQEQTVFLAGAPGGIILAGTQFNLRVTTTESPRDIVRIELWDNDQRMAVAPAAPADFPWAPGTAGLHWIGGRVVLKAGEIPLAAQAQVFVGPRNGVFASRETVAGSSALLAGNLAYASSQAEGPISGAHAWYSWSAPAGGILTLVPDPGDLGMRVFRGSNPGSLVEQARVSPGGASVAVAVQAGLEYHIAAVSLGAVSQFQVRLDFREPPANDAFAARQRIWGSAIRMAGANYAATREAGEPNHAGQPGGGSVWWAWTAPRDGPTAIQVAGLSGGVVGVYSGSDLAGLLPLPGTGSGPAGEPRLLAARAGQEYAIAADSTTGSVGDFTLRIDQAGALDSVKLSWQLKTSPQAPLMIQGLEGRGGVLTASEDLSTWRDLLPLPGGVTDLAVEAPGMDSAAHRFYRWRAP